MHCFMTESHSVVLFADACHNSMIVNINKQLSVTFLIILMSYFLHVGKSTYKITYITPNLVEGPHGTIGCFEAYPCRCNGPMTTKHDPPLIYDLTSDPSETTPLDPKSPEVRDIIAKAKSAVSEHKRSLVPAQDQFAFMRLMPRFRDQPCCGRFPFCRCTESHATDFTYEGVRPDIPNKDWGAQEHAGTS